MKKTLAYLAKHKDVTVRRELARAHIMVALLAFMSITLLVLGNIPGLTFNSVLSSIAAALLVIVAIISIGVAIAALKLRK